MLITPSADVAAFHAKFGAPTRSVPALPAPERVALRRSLIAEEIDETYRSITQFDLVGLSDGIADSIYVIVGTGLEFGCLVDDADIAEMMKGYGTGFDGRPPAFPAPAVVAINRTALAERMMHLSKWMSTDDIDRIAAELTAAIDQLITLAHDFRIPFAEVWNEVQRSNMSKLEKPDHSGDCILPNSPKDNPARCTCGAVLYREDGKILKGSGFSPPDISSILQAKGWRMLETPDLGNATMVQS